MKIKHINSKASSEKRNSPPLEPWIRNSRDLPFQETKEMDFCKAIAVSEHFEINQVVDNHSPVIFKSNKDTTTQRNNHDGARESRPTQIKSGKHRIA
jgi:hypothetical protein